MPNEMYEQNEDMGTNPQRVAELGRTMDETIADEVDMLTPTGVYSVDGLNALVDGLNKVLPMFKMPAYPTFTEGI